MIKRNGRGGLLAKRGDEQEPGLFDDHDEIVDEIAPRSAEDEPGEDGEESGRKRVWTKVQFGLAALSATPLLFIGGLGGWPWEDEKASAVNVPAGQEGYPVSVQLDRLKIDAGLDALNLDPKTNVLQVPGIGRAGWYEAGPEPGEVGRAVLLGRRMQDGADVFGRLDDTRVGDRIVVTTAGGSKLQFVVRSVEQFKATEVPMDRVYGGPKKEAQLRLISSAGAYDQAKGGFQRNIVIFADLVK